jgi:hypothetical protein
MIANLISYLQFKTTTSVHPLLYHERANYTVCKQILSPVYGN